jgi:AraC-like DNA-binding protein
MSKRTGIGLDGQTRRLLFSGLGVCVVDFRCRAHVEPAGKEEPNPTHSIVFVRRGLFSRTDRERTLVADANQILFFNEGEPYRYAHPLPGGDDCTILTLDDECARTVAERFALARTADGQGPFPIGDAMSTPRAARLHHELLAMLCGDRPVPELAAQDAIAELIDETMIALHRARAASAGGSSAGRARRQETVDAAKLILSRSIGKTPSLSELAATLSCSPFHLSRIFRLTTGLALRQYVRRLRTVLAADRLRRGDDDLTSLALDFGFCDHSHFTNSFRREWGIPPSRIRPLEPGRPPQARSRHRRGPGHVYR